MITSKYFIRSLIAIILFGLITVVAGCKEPTKPVLTEETTKTLSASFPNDFPVYPKATVISSEQLLDEQGTVSVRVRWKAPGTVYDAQNFYASQLAHKGWGMRVVQDLETKRIQIWRINEAAPGNDRLIISSIDSSNQTDGIYIGVRLGL